MVKSKPKGLFRYWYVFVLAFFCYYISSILYMECYIILSPVWFFGILYHINVEVFKNQSIKFSSIWDKVIDFIRHNLLAIAENQSSCYNFAEL